MVGGLVQQQHVGSAYQGLRERHTLLVAPGQGAHGHVGLQMQAVKRFLHALLPVPGVQRLDAVLQSVQIETVFTAQIEVACGPGVGQTHAGRFKHRAVQVQHRLLRHISHAQTGLGLQRAVVRFLQCRQYLEQRRLARAVAPNQADPFLGFKSEVGVVEQRDVAKGQLRVLQSDECHGRVRVRSAAIIPVHQGRLE
ncbi:hypothetical protein D9M69_541850 [compost metagenome]